MSTIHDADYEPHQPGQWTSDTGGAPRSKDPYAGGVMTKHGWFSYTELDANEVRYTKDRDGRRVIQFPFSRDVSGRPMYREIPEFVMNAQDAQRAEQDRAAD